MQNVDDILPLPDDLFDGDPIPLTLVAELPEFPVDSLPGTVASMVRGVSLATQTDPAMAASAALSVISACAGGHAEIEVRPGWREPLCAYFATIAMPGERKSAVQMAMASPIFDVEAQLIERGLEGRLEAETRKQIATKAAEQQRNVAARSGSDDTMADAIGAAMLADAIEVPPIPRLVADDITPEAAASLLAEQGGRLAIISAEGGIFDIIAGRYSGNVPNMDLWLKGHSGDPLKVDRKGRPPEFVPRPALTLGLMIQPEVLSAIAANRQFRGRGFLARFLYAWPTSRVGRRVIAPPSVSSDVEQAYRGAVQELASGMAEWRRDPAVLTLTDTAQKAIQTVEHSIEPTLAGAGELASLADWGAKYAGAIARLAGFLHLIEHGATVGPRTAVGAQTILAASQIGGYFKASAIKVFAEMGADAGVADAAYLLERMGHLGDDISVRDLFTACSRSRFKNVADLTPAIERLLDHGYLRPSAAPKPTGGRPASPRFKVHPRVAEAAQAAKNKR